MKEIRNMGAWDRGLRAFVVAPVAIVAAFALGAGTVVGIVLFVVAAIMLATAATGFCPNYIWLASQLTMACITSGTASATATRNRRSSELIDFPNMSRTQAPRERLLGGNWSKVRYTKCHSF